MTVAVSLDGVMVPMKDAKRPHGSAGCQEARCGLLVFARCREGSDWDDVLWPDAAAAQGCLMYQFQNRIRLRNSRNDSTHNTSMET